jgi:hypothetical protein
MKTVNSVDWRLLLETDNDAKKVIGRWSSGQLTTREASSQLAHTTFAGEFRHLVRENGTTYGRRLARKALKYRGLSTL